MENVSHLGVVVFEYFMCGGYSLATHYNVSSYLSIDHIPVLFIESLGVDVGHGEGRRVFVYEIIVI